MHQVLRRILIQRDKTGKINTTVSYTKYLAALGQHPQQKAPDDKENYGKNRKTRYTTTADVY